MFKAHNHALSKRHIFTLFSDNRYDHERIRVLVNIFSIRFSNLKKKKYSVVYHIRHFDFQRRMEMNFETVTLQLRNFIKDFF